MEAIKKVILTAAFIFGFGLIVSAPAQARNLRGACKANIEKVCKDIKPGEDKIKACLKKTRKNFQTNVPQLVKQ